jgi:hypothetical protein
VAVTEIEQGSWAQVFDGGLPKLLAGPAGAAISRLIGAAVEIPAAYVDGLAQSIRDRTEGRSTVMQALAAKAAEQAVADPVLVDRALQTLLSKAVRAQKYKDAVALAAAESLNERPPPENSRGPSEDWIDRFEGYAEGASSQDLQDLFGRILAGEIRKPGSVSAATLHLCSLLDANNAALIEKAARIRALPSGILKSSAKGYLNYGEEMTLRDVGFLGADSLGTTWTVPLASDTMLFVDLNGSCLGISFPKAPKKSFDLIPITAAGVGLIEAIATKVDEERVLEGFKAEGAVMLFRGQFGNDANGRRTAKDMTVFWTKPKDA